MVIFLDLLQNYNGAVTAISTVVLTVTTIVYAILTAILAKENRLLRRAGTEPDVVAYLIPDHRHIIMMNLVIANVGRGPARNIAIRFIGNVEDFLEHNVAINYKEETKILSVLPQDERFLTFFGSSIDMLGGEKPLTDFLIEVSFDDINGNRKKSVSRGSVKDFVGVSRIGDPPEVEMADNLKKIADEIRKWSRDGSRLKVEIITVEQQSRGNEAMRERIMKDREKQSNLTRQGQSKNENPSNS